MQEMELHLLDNYRAIARCLRSKMLLGSRLIFGGPCPGGRYTQLHASSLRRISEEMQGMREIDYVIDFLQPVVHNGVGGWMPGACDEDGKPTDVGHQQLFQCIDLVAVVGKRLAE
eukprot:TRINITY_DN77381_c0_g1_i1.p1 TRINITY_DN77381_c0_g1~~TRINITY_DN77381_c0_g1_i1.p1  ORF type:complete len:125 (+),score=13.80 TRINITY_DN77381_c0_g1_i1:31-375(+)